MNFLKRSSNEISYANGIYTSDNNITNSSLQVSGPSSNNNVSYMVLGFVAGFGIAAFVGIVVGAGYAKTNSLLM